MWIFVFHRLVKSNSSKTSVSTVHICHTIQTMHVFMCVLLGQFVHNNYHLHLMSYKITAFMIALRFNVHVHNHPWHGTAQMLQFYESNGHKHDLTTCQQRNIFVEQFQIVLLSLMFWSKMFPISASPSKVVPFQNDNMQCPMHFTMQQALSICLSNEVRPILNAWHPHSTCTRNGIWLGLFFGSLVCVKMQ